jgi:hypothetical protein
VRRDDCDPPRWNFVPVKPGAEQRFRRTNLILIWVLAILVVGVMIATIVPHLGHVA